jgi:hypothetical protein
VCKIAEDLTGGLPLNHQDFYSFDLICHMGPTEIVQEIWLLLAWQQLRHKCVIEVYVHNVLNAVPSAFIPLAPVWSILNVSTLPLLRHPPLFCYPN